MKFLQNWQTVLATKEGVKAYDKYIQKIQQHIGCFLEYRLKIEEPNDTLPLSGIPYAVKDNIAVKNFKLTCGSKILENLTSPYDATAIKLLSEKGARVIAKTNLDEFGMGSSTDNSALMQTNNPWNKDHVCGGSSGGSAAAVAAGLVPFALGSDTGGSVRQPASFCGCLGLKPTYGAISRYGLVAYASSLEGIGIFSHDIDTMDLVFSTIKGQDLMDQSSVAYPSSLPDSATAKVGYWKDIEGLSKSVELAYKETQNKLADLGVELVPIEINALKYVVPAYYTIATAEASSNLARYTGVRYGHRANETISHEKMTSATRNEGFGDEVKLRILLGTYVLRSGFQDQYYIRAQKIRTAIREGFYKAFDQVDLILSPVYPTLAFKRGEASLSPFRQKLADAFTASANLAGIPALAFPTGIAEGLPVGMQFLAPAFAENRMFEMVRKLKEFAHCPTPENFDKSWRTK